MKTWLLALGALCVFIAEPREADAAVTATLSITSPTPYSGVCPVTDQFKGTIAGTPGTTFTYSFNRFVNGMQHVVNGGAVKLPPSGSIAVNDSIPITTSALANTFDQIWVHNISGGQSDVYSNKANFVVNCNFFGSIHGLTVFTPPPPPDSLTNTTDPPTCTNHGGFGAGLACLAGIPKGQLALIWNWSPVKGVPKVDGFKIYRVDGSQHTFVPANGAYSNDGTITVAVLDTPPDGFNGKCYVVTSYVGTAESHDSSYFCAGGYQGGPIVESFTQQPTAVQTFSHSYQFTDPVCGVPLTATGNGPTLGLVGFRHTYIGTTVTCDVANTAWETALGFDLGAAGIVLRGSKASVKSATLTFQRTDGSKASCVAGVHLPTIDWSGFGGQMIPVPHDDYRGNIPWSAAGVNADLGVVKIFNGGGSYAIDVASAVSDFAKGNRANHGFLLVGGNEDFSGEDNNICSVFYGGFTLNIQVVINP